MSPEAPAIVHADGVSSHSHPVPQFSLLTHHPSSFDWLMDMAC